MDQSIKLRKQLLAQLFVARDQRSQSKALSPALAFLIGLAVGAAATAFILSHAI